VCSLRRRSLNARGARESAVRAAAKKAGSRKKGGAQGRESGPTGEVQQAGEEGRAEECPAQEEQGRDDPGNDRTTEGRDSRGDHGCSAHIDHLHRGLRQLESSSHLTGGRALASLSHNLFEALTERSLGGQLLDLFHPDSALWTAHSVHFHYHRRAIHAPRQIADFSLPYILHLV
jgi:hypothetical protein